MGTWYTNKMYEKLGRYISINKVFYGLSKNHSKKSKQINILESKKLECLCNNNYIFEISLPLSLK